MYSEKVMDHFQHPRNVGEKMCIRDRTEGDQTAGEQSTFNAVEDIQKNTVQRKRKIQNGKLSEGIVPEGLFFEKNRNRAVFLRGPAVRDGQAGHQKETRKEFAGGSTECSDSGRGEACGKTEKPGKVGSAHADVYKRQLQHSLRKQNSRLP